MDSDDGHDAQHHEYTTCHQIVHLKMFKMLSFVYITIKIHPPKNMPNGLQPLFLFPELSDNPK